MNPNITITLDQGHHMPVYSKVCVYCKHLHVTQGCTCAAFLERDGNQFERRTPEHL